jgi:peptide/nickel transport system substrate-binding protein
MPRLNYTFRLPVVILLLIAVAVGCAAPSTGGTATSSAPGQAQPAAAPTAPKGPMVLVLRAEPPQLSDRIDRMGLGFPWVVGLAGTDNHDQKQPILAVELPSQDKGTWVVNADGTMKTTWVLKPNLKWQDGEPLTADDFVFAHQVYTDREVPITNRLPEQLMSRVQAVDDRTIEITWREPYVDADALVLSQLTPIPRHVVGDAYNADKAAFATSSFWTSEEFVGDGPYRWTKWEHGVALAGSANPYFVMGKPRIETIEIKWVADNNTIVAGFLAGTINFSEYTAVDVDQAVILQDRWNVDHAGQVYTDTLFGLRYMEFQHRDVPEWQPALNDVRVRQALMHSLDRQSLTDALQHGYGGVADTAYPKGDRLYSRMDAAIAHYPYDLRRAEQLFNQAGWTKGADGMFRNASGQVFDIEVRETGEREQEGTIITDNWRQAGLGAKTFVIPRAATTDVAFRVNFPGVALSASTEPVIELIVTTEQGATAANKFTGKNRGNYSNPEIDRLYGLSLTTINQAQRDDVLVSLEKLYTTDVASGTVFYQPRTGISRGIKGVLPPVRGTHLWNVWEWTQE